MLRFIDIDPNGTTIERFPIDNNASIWLAKRGDTYGVSLDKHRAISQLEANETYSEVGYPRYLNLPGREAKNNGEMKIVVLPGAGKFIHSLLSLELKQEYHYGTIYCEEVNSVALLCKPANKAKACFVLHTSQGYIPDQVRRCIYQLYIEIDKGIDFDLKINDTNIKQREWITQWMKRLPARGFSL